MNKYPLITVILLNHNNYKYTDACIKSLQKLSYKNFNILIVDDFSTDDSVKNIKENHSSIKLIENKKNLHYCKSFNVGIKEVLKGESEYIFLVNNDTKDFSTNYFEKIISTFNSDKTIGLVGSKCYDYNGKVRRDAVASIRFGIKMDTPTEGYVIKREVFESIGLLNENLIIYFEDLDFIVRMRDAGYTTKINTEISFLHYGGVATSKRIFKSNFLRIRNFVLFTRKYCSNETIIWKLREIKSNLNDHLLKLKKHFIRFEIFKSFKMIFAITIGLLFGILTPLNKIWKLN